MGTSPGDSARGVRGLRARLRVRLPLLLCRPEGELRLRGLSEGAGPNALQTARDLAANRPVSESLKELESRARPKRPRVLPSGAVPRGGA